MMKAILLSIKPEWAEKIYNGEKTIEWRKSRPSIDRNNRHTRVYIYETAPVKRITGYFTLFGTFAVDVKGMLKSPVSGGRHGMAFGFVREMLEDMERRGCVPAVDLAKYQAGAKEIYCWTVSPFMKPTRIMPVYRLDDFGLKRPPQSWQYVEDLV
jgi:predicted transcriptional regulator